MKTGILSLTLGSLLVIGGMAIAQPPRRNVSAARHPNLAAAQRLVKQAWEKVTQAQQANEWDMGGHAKRAKELLDDADRELKLAAEVSNRNAK